MKKILFSIVTGALLLMSSCNDDLLDTKNLYGKNLDSFYQKPQDIHEAMAGVYATLHVQGVHSDEHIAANLLSDLMLGGGGPDDITAKYVDAFTDPKDDTYKALWVETFTGVYRANAIIEAMIDKDYSDYFDTDEEADDFKAQSLGEAYFMRGFLLFRAAKFFGGLPLIISTGTPRDIPLISASIVNKRQ